MERIPISLICFFLLATKAYGITSFCPPDSTRPCLKDNSFFVNENLKACKIKTSEETSESWYDEYSLVFKIDSDLIDKKSSYLINTYDNKLEIIASNENGDVINSLKVNSLSTLAIGA